MLPVAVTEETFRHNGIISAQDAQELPVAKLREIFGADAAQADATAATLRALGESVYAIGTIAPRGDGAAVVVA